MYKNSAFMELLIGLTEANSSFSFDVPVGSLITVDDKIVCYSFNEVESRSCSIMHSEILSIIRASEILDQKYLSNCNMYVTLEPCPMCMNAILRARICRLYFSSYRLNNYCADSRSCATEIYGGIMSSESKNLVKNFFKSRREKDEFC